MKNKISCIRFIVAVLFMCTMIHAQNTLPKVFEDWTTTGGTQNTFQHSIARSKGLGGATYHYVAGATLNGNGDYDMLVSKYNNSGLLLWTQTYNGAGNGDDFATDVQIDAVGNVYICGSYYKDATDSNNAIIIKYNNAGTQKWVYTYNGAGSQNDGFGALSAAGNSIIACGTTWLNSTNLYDMLIIRVDSSGNNVWTTTKDFYTLNDGAHNMYSSGGSLYVAGGTQTTTTTYKYAVLKMVPSTGAITSSNISGGTGLGIDQIADIQTDATGNIYITGSAFDITSFYDIRTLMLDSTLNIVWSASYDAGSNLNDFGTGIKVDAHNNVIVSGSSETTGQGIDFTTIKYNSVGTQLWVANYDGGIAANDSATAIVINDTDHIYVTGYSDNGSSLDYHTVRYDASGNEIWGISYNSASNLPDIANAIALDTLGDVIVTGESGVPGAMQYVTVKYSDHDVLVMPDTVVAGSGYDEFVANRGQMRDENFASDTKVKFYCRGIKPEICLLNQSTTSFVTGHIDADSTTQDTVVRVDMTYKSANNVNPKSYDISAITSSYYLSHISGAGAIRINQYQHVIYPDLYTDIDMLYGTDQGGVKCYYIIKPGGNPSDIEAIFSGASSIAISGNDVGVRTLIDTFYLAQATAFQIDGSGNFVSLGWQPSYTIPVSNHIKFGSLGSYNNTQPLVFAIQFGNYASSIASSNGNILASTFVGGSLDEVFYDVESAGYYDFGVGSTRSMPFPGNAGSVFSNFYGTTDGFMASYETGYAVLHAYCFIGGSGEDIFNAVTDDRFSNTGDRIFFAGQTMSSGIQTASYSSGMYYQNTLQGGKDAFIGNIDRNFSFSPWRTYFGGSGNEQINGLCLTSGYLYFTGTGDNNSPLKNETNSYYSNSGTTLIGKFNYQDTTKWCTLFGNGNGKGIYHNGGHVISVVGDATGSIPIVTPGGSYVDNSASATDAFIARFNSADTVKWSTYYGGTGNDDAKGTVVDHNGNIYVTGTTYSSNFPFYYTNNVPYEDSIFSGSRDAFLAQFDSTGHRIWSSFFGGQYAEDGTDVDIDYWNDVYFVGYTSSDDMYTRNGGSNLYNQSAIGGNPLNTSTWGDGYIFMLKPNLQPAWCTYFGGNFVDGIWGVAVNGSSYNMIIGGYAGSNDSTSFPIVGTGAHWSNAGWGNDDAFYTRFNITNIYTIPTALQENSITQYEFVVYPNPGNGELVVNLGKDEIPQKLVVMNSLGQIVFSQKTLQIDGDGRLYLDFSRLDQGIYFLNLDYGDKSETQKFSIIR